MHPKNLDKLRTFIAKRSLFVLVLYYVIAVFVVSSLLGFLFFFFSGQPGIGFFQWVLYTFVNLFCSDLPNSTIIIGSTLLPIFILVKILSVILPTLFLGSIVFKIFIVPKILVFRKNCLIYYSKKRKCYVIAFKFYSATQLMIYGLNITSVARIYMESNKSSNTGFISNESLSLDKSFFATVSSHIPFTIILPLTEADVTIQENERHLVSIQGYKFRDSARITLLLAGTISEIGTSFVEKYSYVIPNQLVWKMFDHIDVSNEREWEYFET